MNLAQLESKVFALPIQDRAALAKRLILSLKEVSDAKFETLWGEESVLRAAELDLGMTQAIPGQEVTKSTCFIAVKYSFLANT
jgi:putative addiction module component